LDAKKQTLQDLFHDDPEMLRVLEIREQTGLLKSIAQKNENSPLEALKLMELREQTSHLRDIAAIKEAHKGDKGEKGDTPAKGKDYFTPEEIQRLADFLKSHVESFRPIKGKDYFDGEKGLDGKDGRDGIDGRDGVDGNHGRDGIDGEDGEDGESPDMDEIFDTIVKRFKKEKPLDISHIKNASTFMKDGIKYRVEELMHGGGSGSATSATFVYNEVVAGSGTSFTLANTPVVGTVQLFGIGQRFTPTVDYTIVGASITTVNSWNTGDILSDYQKS